MIANAGTIQRLPLVDMTVEDWDRVMTVNTRSVMLAYKHAARQMIKQGRGGRIVGRPYRASPSALDALTQCALWDTVGAASMAGKKGEPKRCSTLIRSYSSGG